jgi:hypothetical protein
MHTVVSTQVIHKENSVLGVHIPYVKTTDQLPVVGESVQVVSFENKAKFPGKVTSVNEEARSYDIDVDLSEEIPQ